MTPAPADHIGVEIGRFERYMDGTCGFATSMRRRRGQIITRFLAARFGPCPGASGAFIALDLRRFTLGTNQIRSSGTVRVIADALCQLRFREIEGAPVGDLRASIPGAGHWRLATLPAVHQRRRLPARRWRYAWPCVSSWRRARTSPHARRRGAA